MCSPCIAHTALIPSFFMCGYPHMDSCVRSCVAHVWTNRLMNPLQKLNVLELPS